MDHLILSNHMYTAPSELSARIEESVQSFCAITDVPVTFYGSDNKIIWECGNQNKFCDHSYAYKDPQSSCMKNLASSAKLAARLGEPYIFSCRAGLVMIAVSTVIGGNAMGCAMAGPIVMGDIKESGVAGIFSLDHIHFDALPKAILFIKNVKAYNPKEVFYLSKLFWNSIMAAISSGKDYSGISDRYDEQKKLSLSMQKYKKDNLSMQYPYELENRFFEKVKEGDSKKSIDILTELMERISITETGDLSSIKTKILSICTILIRFVTDSTMLSQEQAEFYYFDMNMLNKSTSFRELSLLTSNFVYNIVKVIETSSYSGNSQLIRSAISDINENYKNKISLTTVADRLHTNSSYLSMLFKQEMGVTFTDYLNQIRINRSCELLANTSLNLIDISFQVGYDDQSYYTKVFKKLKGSTPKNYRNGIAKK